MLKDVRIPLLPQSLDILRWSPDGQLAIVAMEDILILVPKFAHVGEAGRRTRQFETTAANLRQLIVEQMDDQIEPGPAATYSVGEEQSAGYGKEVAWSPLGTSRFRKCVLAILTTNCLVHIFEPYDHPATNWRKLHTLQTLMNEYEGWTNGAFSPHTKRLRSRAQAIAWSPPCYYITESHWGDSVLAVANDNLEIVLFRITRDEPVILSDISPFDKEELVGCIGKCSTFCSHLSWSPWRRSGDMEGHAYLAFAHHGKVYITRVTLTATEAAEDPPFRVSHEKPQCVGSALTEKHPVFALSWAPEEVNGCLVFAYATQPRLSLVVVDENGKIAPKDNLENGFIENVTGLSFSPGKSRDSVLVHLVTMKGKSQIVEFTLSQQKAKTTSKSSVNGADAEMADIATVGDEELTRRATHWPLVMESRMSDFLGENEAASAVARTYGLACSPLGGTIAVACSYHPVGLLQYITYARERMTISFGTHEGSGRTWEQFSIDPDERKVPSPIDIASETTILEAVALRHRFEPAKILLENKDRFFPSEGDVGSLSELISTMRTGTTGLNRILHEPALNAIRYEQCLKMSETTRQPTTTALVESPVIIAYSIASVLATDWSPESTSSPLSQSVLYSLAAMGILAFPSNPHILALAELTFAWLDENTPGQITFAPEVALVKYNQQTPQDSAAGAPGNIHSLTSGLVTCRLCGSGMVWQDLRFADCEKGHRFSRCAMTFLPIQHPDVTKECSVCGRTVLGQGLLGEDRKGLELSEGTVTLAETVFQEWDSCLQCGGKYWARGL